MSNSATKYSPGAYSILYFNDLGVRVNKEILPDSDGYLKAREQARERSATEGYASYVINRVLFNSALKEQERYDVRVKSDT